MSRVATLVRRILGRSDRPQEVDDVVMEMCARFGAEMAARRQAFEDSLPEGFTAMATAGVHAAARADAEKDPETLAREIEQAEQDSWAMRHVMNGLPVPGGFRDTAQVRRLGRMGFVSRAAWRQLDRRPPIRRHDRGTRPRSRRATGRVRARAPGREDSEPSPHELALVREAAA